MKAFRWTGLGIIILLGLFVAYIGAYWFARKSEVGNEFFSSGESSWQKRPLWIQRAEVKLWLPARDMEHWLGEYRQRRHLPGEWISKDGKEQLVIDANMNVTLWGFSDLGFPEGTTDETTWGHWGTADAYLVVFSKGQQAFVAGLCERE